MRGGAFRAIEFLVAVVVFALPVSAAHARTLSVSGGGVDGPLCGPREPCRSISQAIANADPRDVIVVGPGTYGDLNRNGVLGEPGEETGAPGCNCMLAVDKAVVIISTDGAGETFIDARPVNLFWNVSVTAGAELGRPGRGFTVTPTGRPLANQGIVVTADAVQVRGNQVVAFPPANAAAGIFAASPGSVLIEGNQVMGWANGIVVNGAGSKIVRRNLVSLNATGIHGDGTSTVEGNVVTGGLRGLSLFASSTAVRNAIYGNVHGVQVGSFFSGTIEENNISGNSSCGLSNIGAPALAALRNYWGAATGPGPDPADDVCNATGSTTVVTPFATRPFIVRAPFTP